MEEWQAICSEIEEEYRNLLALMRQVEPSPAGFYWKYKRRFRQFMAFIELQPDGCWKWLGGIDFYGYGTFRFMGTNAAHCASWLFYRGPYDAECIRHLCHNRLCVNPLHLEPGTRKQNQWDSWELGNYIGEQNGSAILGEEAVKRIRGILIAEPWRTQEDIGQEFRVCRAAIGHIKSGYTWGHVEGHILPPAQPKLIRRI